MSLLKKWFIWAVGAVLIAGGAFFLYPVPENGGQETAPPVSAAEGQKEPAAAEATSSDGVPEKHDGPGQEEAFGPGEPLKKKKRKNTYGPGTWWYEEPVQEEPQGPAPTDKDLVWIASDTHYVSPKMTDYGPAFRERLDRDDGKDLEDIDQIMDRWIDEVLEERPGTVILSGDLVMDGETVNHRELSEKLKRLQDDGITVLVIPGNHDIRVTMWAASYHGDRKEPAETPMDRDAFLEIWHSFGYDQASASDASSLSYLYKTDDRHWFLMLDSAIYEPENRVTGRIRPETLAWMEACFQQAEEAGAEVIPVAHHNLLYESRLFRRDCTLENYRETVDVLHRHGIRLWFSGHLHLQRIRQYRPEPGLYSGENVTEIVNGCFSMYPFPYGELRFGEDRHVTYRQRTVDIPEELRAEGLAEYRRVITGQVSGDIRGVPDYIRANMADSYVGLMVRYVSGEAVDEKEFCSELGYRMMLKYMDGSLELEKIREMLSDTKQDCRSWEGDL